MVDRPSFRPPVQIRPAAQIDLSNTSGEFIQNLSNTFNRMRVEVDKRLDKKARIDATRDGIRDGQSGRVDADLLYAPTLRGEAYTQSALETYSRTLELQTKDTLDDLANKHQFDPNKFKEEAEAYINGRAEDMPEAVDSTVGESYLQRSALSVNTYQAEANARAVALERSSRKAGVERQQRRRVLEVDRLSAHIYSDNNELRERALTELFQNREDIIASYQSTFTDAFGNEHPVYSPEESQRALEEFSAQTRVSSVKNWFNSQPSKIDALRHFERGNLKAEAVDLGTVKDVPGGVKVLFEPLGEPGGSNVSALSTGEIEQMVSFMRAGVSRDLNLQKNAAVQAEKVEKRNDDIKEADFYAEEDPIARETKGQDIMATSADPARVKRVREDLNELGPQGHTESGVLRQVDIDIADGILDDPSDLDGYNLSRKDRQRLSRTLIDRRNNNSVVSTKSFSTAVDLIYLDKEKDTKQGFSSRATKKKESEAVRIEAELTRWALDEEEAGRGANLNFRAKAEELLGAEASLQSELNKVQDQMFQVTDQITERSRELKNTEDPNDPGMLGSGWFKGMIDPNKDSQVKNLMRQLDILEGQQTELQDRLTR